MKNKKRFFIIFSLILFIIILISFTTMSYCADQKLVNTMKKAFEQIEEWLLKLATPAAAVAIGTGVFMKKFRSHGIIRCLRTPCTLCQIIQ